MAILLEFGDVLVLVLVSFDAFLCVVTICGVFVDDFQIVRETRARFVIEGKYQKIFATRKYLQS